MSSVSGVFQAIWEPEVTVMGDYSHLYPSASLLAKESEEAKVERDESGKVMKVSVLIEAGSGLTPATLERDGAKGSEALRERFSVRRSVA